MSNINDENLPENKKTKKRLLEVEEDEPTPMNNENEVEEEEEEIEITKEDTKGSEQGKPVQPPHYSPLNGSNSAQTFQKTLLSPMMGGIVIQSNQVANAGLEEDNQYFSGRRLVSTSDSGSSDLSDSETKSIIKLPKQQQSSSSNGNDKKLTTTTTTTSTSLSMSTDSGDNNNSNSTSGLNDSGSAITNHQSIVGSNMQKKKKRKLKRKEGRIYELLEKRLGSQALREGYLGTQFISFDWPYELILVRHGQSEGNEAQARSKKGDLSAYTDEFKRKHSSVYRLTDKGILQAKIAGKYVRENIAEVFDRYYTSEYVRAMETASLLGLTDANWLTEIQLRERDKGKMDNISWTEKNERFGHEMDARKRDSFFWSPPDGESIANICQRVEHTFITLRRECSNKRVIIVAHGEIMWAIRVRLERLSQLRFHQLQSSKDPRDQIHNTTILHYSRIHPKTGEIFPYFKFLHSVCPWKPEYSSPGWSEFERPVYSNEEMMESVRTVPRYVNNIDFDLEKEEQLFGVGNNANNGNSVEL